jgi:hypothetical protein
VKLSPIRSPQKPPRFATFDIETRSWTKFIVLGYFDGTEYREFRKLSAFLKFLSENDTPETLVAHFGGKFDFLFLIEEILKNGRIENIVPRGSGILYFDYVTHGRRLTFRDSSALLPFGLKSITENFGVETKKKEWDHSKTRGYSKALSEYLRADCIGLYQSLGKLFEWPLIQKAGPSWTMAGQATRVLRTYLEKDLYGLGTQETAFCRKAYLGGRTEIFKPIAREPLYEYDFNSIYPKVMHDNEFPVGSSVFSFDYDPHRLGIWRARVSAPDIYIPVLGIVRENKFIFPTGTFEGHWTSAEIEYARTLGYRVDVFEGYVFGDSQRIFQNFISDLYAIRLTSPKKSVSEILAKLLMNSSYGRFGMDLDKENIGFELKEGAEPYTQLKVGRKKIQLFKEPVQLKSYTNVAIAAFVTSYARIMLHRAMHPIADQVYYCDTDSIFTTAVLPTGTALGDLKLEDTHADGAVFLLPKTYFAAGGSKGKKIAMKGFSNRKIQEFTLEDFKAGLEGDLHRFKIVNEPKFATLKTAIGLKKLVTMTKTSEKQLRSQYNKRKLVRGLGNVFETVPIKLEE